MQKNIIYYLQSNIRKPKKDKKMISGYNLMKLFVKQIYKNIMQAIQFF